MAHIRYEWCHKQKCTIVAYLCDGMQTAGLHSSRTESGGNVPP